MRKAGIYSSTAGKAVDVKALEKGTGNYKKKKNKHHQTPQFYSADCALSHKAGISKCCSLSAAVLRQPCPLLEQQQFPGALFRPPPII